MFLHHVVTILLILTSYVIAQFRIGTVIMFLHDSTDYWLEVSCAQSFKCGKILSSFIYVIVLCYANWLNFYYMGLSPGKLLTYAFRESSTSPC